MRRGAGKVEGMLLVLWSAGALAATPLVRVSGVEGARAVALLVEQGGEVRGFPCADAASVWTCGPLAAGLPGAVRLAILRDGRILDAGAVELDATGASLRVRGGQVVATPGAGPGTNGTPQGAGLPTVVARVSGSAEGSAPVLHLQGSAGGAEVMCRDDGTFPDVARNDGEHGCAGVAPGHDVSVQLNGKDGQTLILGSVQWSPTEPIHRLMVDLVARTALPGEFALPTFVPATLEEGSTSDPPPGDAPPGDAPPGDPAVGSDPVPPPPGPDPVPPPPPGSAGSPSPGAGVPEHRGSREPVATRETSGGTLLALGLAGALGLIGANALLRRAPRLPASLRPLPAPPLLPGGPSLADLSVAIEAPDPDALAAALLPALARHRRVVVVAPRALELPPMAEGPVYRVDGADCEIVEAAVRALARTPGPGLAVLVIGSNTLVDPGAVAGDPVTKLRGGLPPGVWMAVIGERESSDARALSRWTAAGPPWALVRAEPSA